MAEPPRFYITGSTGGSYHNFIRELRRLFAHPGTFAHNVPALIQENDNRVDNLIEVVLRTETHAVRLSIRRDNLYLTGFRDDTPGSTWFELDSDQQRIPGSISVLIAHSYMALEGAAGISRQTRLAVMLGRHYLDVSGFFGVPTLSVNRTPLSAAVNQLAALRNPAPDGNRQATGYSLLVVIQMLSESIRFGWISDHLDRNWLTDLTTPIRMIEFENAWRTLSEALIHADQDPAPEDFRLPRNNNFGITNAFGLVAVLGILHYRGHLPLDLSRSILAGDSFNIALDLWDKDFDPSPDDSIVKETIYWYPSNVCTTWDQPITQRVSGESGTSGEISVRVGWF
ncbi:ribosome-inactivating protein [Xylaria bambusicola]|uniref:ribosome-inactivating protein n=1 Tax=Xylaria bambusicola TaxID=326684 RepID=UPI0020072175|nr:ribosome-inactivating protein [Xylaria bambusicola]KAI0521126.1 ribosome-inactivating protein [Xylaria bambusicola]